MKQRAIIRFGLLIAALLGLAMGLFWMRAAPRTSGPMRHDIYVWQRAWTQPVRDAVAQHGGSFTEIVPLKAEISWKDKKPQLTKVGVDYATLARLLPTGTDPRQRGASVGIAMRIGPYSGPFIAPGTPVADPSPANSSTQRFDGPGITRYLTDLAAALVAEARSNHVALSELQIDFDCAESKLDGYRIWVEAIRNRVAPLPVTITALPSWLDAAAFKRLATIATNYVLQVHSVERPKSASAPFTLCDPGLAVRAVERAGRIGIPFRVALPTYGYTLAFEPAGKFLGLSAEGPRPNWPTNVLIREVFSDPVQLSKLVQGWTASRPESLTGVIWYRLPTIVDNFNWRWPTLEAIVASRSLQEKLRCESRRVEAGLMEVSLVNAGDLDISSRLAVEVRWSDARLIASDALRDFELADRSTSAARFQTRSQPCRLRAGDRLTLGWLRFDRDCEVRCEIKKP